MPVSRLLQLNIEGERPQFSRHHFAGERLLFDDKNCLTKKSWSSSQFIFWIGQRRGQVKLVTEVALLGVGVDSEFDGVEGSAGLIWR